MEFTGERLVPTVEGFDDLFLEHVTRYLFAAPLAKDGIVLDAGCGAGYGAYHLLKAGAHTVVGIDISEEAVNYCRNNYLDKGISFEERSVLNTEFQSRSFDTIVSFEVFEHLEDPEMFLKEMRRILKPDGLFIVSTPNAKTYTAGGEDGENEFHFREYTPEEFGEILGRHFGSIHWYAQSPLGGLGIVPLAIPEDTAGLPTTTRNIAPPSRSTWGEAQQPRVSLDKCLYTIAICSPTTMGEKALPDASLFTMGDDLATISGQLDMVVQNRDALAGDVKKRDGMITRLQGELEDRGNWARDPQKEIDHRDETIRDLQNQVEDRSRWALKLDEQAKLMHVELEQLKRKQNSIL